MQTPEEKLAQEDALPPHDIHSVLPQARVSPNAKSAVLLEQEDNSGASRKLPAATINASAEAAQRKVGKPGRPPKISSGGSLLPSEKKAKILEEPPKELPVVVSESEVNSPAPQSESPLITHDLQKQISEYKKSNPEVAEPRIVKFASSVETIPPPPSPPSPTFPAEGSISESGDKGEATLVDDSRCTFVIDERYKRMLDEHNRREAIIKCFALLGVAALGFMTGKALYFVGKKLFGSGDSPSSAAPSAETLEKLASSLEKLAVTSASVPQ